MTIIITPSLKYPLAYWLRQVKGYVERSKVDGLERLVIEL